MNTLGTIFLYIAVLTSPVLSAPQPAAVAVKKTAAPHLTWTHPSQTIKHGAADGVQPTKAAKVVQDIAQLRDRMANPPDHLTIEIINAYGKDITTSHASNAGSPTPVGGPIQPGIVPNGTTASFAVPTGWAGNVAMNRANMSINGDVTLLEASFVVADGWDHAVAGVDVSFVNGFTVPITCECDGNYVAGCRENLLGPKGRRRGVQGPAGAAVNPLRADVSASSARPLFAPCEGLAYTFPSDHAANSFGECQSGLVSCCVGTGCRASAPEA